MILWMVFLLGINVNGQNLEEYLQYGAENNPELQAALKEYEAALEAVPQAKSLPDPLLSFGYFLSPVETRVGPQQAKFGISQMFPWFGSLQARSSVSEALAQVRYENYLQIRNSYFLKVRVNYYKLYEIKQVIRINNNNLDILKSWENLAIRKYEGGLTGMVDVLRVQMMIAEMESTLQSLQKDYETQIQTFNLLLNKDSNEKLDLDSKLNFPDDDFEIQGDSLSNHPLISILEWRKLAAEKSIDVEKRNNKPNFGLGLDYILVGPASSDIPESGKNVLMPMISLSLPIWGKKNEARIHEKELTLESLESSHANMENKLEMELINWTNSYNDSKRDYDLYNDLIGKADQALRVLVADYTSANKDFDEVLKMQQVLLKYEMALEKSITSRYIAGAQIDYLFNR